MLTDASTATTSEGTEAAQTATTGDGAQTEGNTLPSFDWESAKSHPEFKTHVKTYLETDEEFRKEASRGVRMTDVERRAEERASVLVGETKTKLTAAETRLKALEDKIEQDRLSTMTYDEQEQYRLNKSLADANAELADFRSKESVRAQNEAVEQILGYAKDTWGLDDDAIGELRKSSDTTDLWDRALKAANKKHAALTGRIKELETQNEAKGRVLDGTSTFAAVGNTSSGGDMSPDEIRDAFRNTGTSSPNHAKISALYAKVRAQYGY